MAASIAKHIPNLVETIIDDYKKDQFINRMDTFHQPNHKEIIALTDELVKIAYLGFFKDGQDTYPAQNIDGTLAALVTDLAYRFTTQIGLALRFKSDVANTGDLDIDQMAVDITNQFIMSFPKVREYLELDLQATLDGDPATGYKEEIIMCYPGFFAITVNRFAHELFTLGVPLIPRIMTEYAHSTTGIDIHPGATIGKRFFIDHGTGIVIGETTVIGDNVKLYQGVTLGGLSTRGGQTLRGKRRHPTIKDNVTIYAGASILGGDTIIGEGSIIGSNVFITHSVPAGTRVSIKTQELDISQTTNQSLDGYEMAE